MRSPRHGVGHHAVDSHHGDEQSQSGKRAQDRCPLPALREGLRNPPLQQLHVEQRLARVDLLRDAADRSGQRGGIADAEHQHGDPRRGRLLER